ncbi:hypothetical protein [Xanthomonas sacchari]|uniref:hypothetical protein n=1 Tax=Xanthomonas sacchari TaxID=56458 RepID=UPI0012E04A5F|nr:hypothetical protein [Xanthomonas sacchari]
MSDEPRFRGHHIFEQVAYKDSRLLQELAKRGLFHLHDEGNILNLPINDELAAKMGISPHHGGPLGSYSKQLATLLKTWRQLPMERPRSANWEHPNNRLRPPSAWGLA